MSMFGLFDHPEQVTREFLQFVEDHGVPRLNFEDFEVIQFLCSGSFGSCYKARRRTNGEIVALKFFGYTTTSPLTDLRAAETEIEVDWSFNGLESTAKCLGYMVDSYDGLVKDVIRARDFDMGYGEYPHSTGKRHKSRVVVKVSECLFAEVLDYILTMDMKKINDKEISRIFKSFVEGLAFIHKAGYIHRDLKPENIMMNENGEVRLIDFGMARRIPDGATEIIDSKKGSDHYRAPETQNSCKTSEASDMWTVGTILYVMLFSDHACKTDRDISLGSYGIPPHITRSEKAMDLLSKLLQLDPVRRLTCEEVLQHPWITRAGELEEFTHEVESFGEEYTNNIKLCSYNSRLKRILRDKISESIKRKRILTFAYKKETQTDINLTVEQFHILRESFFAANKEAARQLSENSSDETPILVTGIMSSLLGGTSPASRPRNPSVKVVAGGRSSALPYEMFCEVMMVNKLNPFAKKEIFDVFDLDKSGKIDYFEFMLILASLRVDNKSEHLEEEASMYFDIFDLDGSGVIQREEFVSFIYHILGSNGDIDTTNVDQLFASISASTGSSGLDRAQFLSFYKTLISGSN